MLFGPLGIQGGCPPLGPIIFAELCPLLPVLVPALVDDPIELKSSESSSPLGPVVPFGSYWLFSDSLHTKFDSMG